jgi:octaprenyl-diphosphate synthase
VSASLDVLLRERVASLVGEDFRACEAEIARELTTSPVGLVRDLSEHVALAGGKRLRPMLVLLTARLGREGSVRARRLGCVVELLHTATLIHDDVVDGAALRRGRPSAHAHFGPAASILVGDHLYSRCMALLVADGDLAVMDALASAMVSMTEAEVFQLERKRAGSLSEADYFRIIRQKTATFIASCCRVGGLVGGLQPGYVSALGMYGERMGIAFQIIDDALDFTADEARLGKEIGSDLREGKRTLPVIATLDRATAAERDRILSTVARPDSSEADLSEVQRLVKVYDGVGYAVARASDFAAEAVAALREVPASPARDTLELIAEYVVRRDR